MTLRVPRLPFSLDPLIAEAKRRARRRRLLLALGMAAGGAVAVAIALHFGTGPGGPPSPAATGGASSEGPVLAGGVAPVTGGRVVATVTADATRIGQRVRVTQVAAAPIDASHSVLWRYGPVLAMGAAAGRDSRHHHRGYTYLFVGGDAGYTPTYTYTWSQAVADGAGTNTYDPGPSPRLMCHVPVLIGMKLRGATRKIAKAHCTVGEVINKHTNYVPGVVIRQYPKWGKTLATGTRIGLTVSLGPR